MGQVVIENPIINCPYSEPTRHFRFSDEGITHKIDETRRVSSYKGGETMRARNLGMPMEAIIALCQRYRVRELALFGSALRKGLRPDSDVDLLVEFESDAQVGFLTLGGLQRELSTLLGRPVDLVPKGGLKPLIREAVLADAEVLYAA